MRIRTRQAGLLPLAGLAIGAFAVASTGCMQYAADGSVVTPAPPGSSESSRLPSLLSQLQGAGAGIELLDGSQSQVLAAQDAQGKEASTATATVAGEKTPGASSTLVPGTPTRSATATRTPTPTRTPTQASEGASTPTPTPSSTATATATPSPTLTPTPTATPTPSGPPSEGGGSTATPPTES